jgi:DEAD/DEAH box helicase domain-containing protein
MIDPIGSFLRIREFYLTYLETAFRIADPGLTRERRALLEAPGTLCTDPLVEPIPRYRTVDWELRWLADQIPGPLAHLSPASRTAFTRLAQSGLFDSGKARLYRHQAEMLERGSQQGLPGVVTSGTGSGKTESFLMPVLATILDEARSWSAPASNYLKAPWWHRPEGGRYEKFTTIPTSSRPLAANPEADPFRSHRTGENRPAAVRCLVLYPMNALVEDQLPRLRKAIDSSTAKAVLDEECSGNRIFFGRYTGKTPVTGFNRHPRIEPSADRERRARVLGDLFDHMVAIEEAQSAVEKAIVDGSLQPDDRYLFPRIGGSELLSRWDMQATPPDILITNVSMLGAILNREVDSGIFESTKRWLEADDSSYFFLIADELHLQRGSAGTEVAYLLRLLFEKLGLNRKEHRHKLRVLASSASLPTEGIAGQRSARYLWDMFGSFGTWKRSDAAERNEEVWRNSVIPGETEPEQPRSGRVLAHEPFRTFARDHGATNRGMAEATHPKEKTDQWRSIGAALGIAATGSLHEDVRAIAEEAGARVSRACWSESENRVRATPLVELARRLFGQGDAAGVEAVRGLLIARGFGDEYRSWFPWLPEDERVRSPSFRLHTFFRSVEGLYAPASGADSLDESFRSPTRSLGPLSIERGAVAGISHSGEMPPKLIELLYCECCGTTLLGGLRRIHDKSAEIELLPFDPELDGLPDSSAGRLFERLSYDQYALFWPSPTSEAPRVANAGSRTPEAWVRAHLDPATAAILVQRAILKKSVPDDALVGWLFSRKESPSDKHGRSNRDEGSHVPYQCPSCETDYSPRPNTSRELRLSPVRHFRTGFAKTTQLLASELFGVLQTRQDENSAKLVSFSDSRQEAANAALDIESRHHEDVRREALIKALRIVASQRRPRDVLEKERQATKQRLIEAVTGDDEVARTKAAADLERIELQLRTSHDPSVPIAEILEDPEGSRFKGRREDGRERPKQILSAFAALGIHPTDPAGIRQISVELSQEKGHYDWTQLIGYRDGEIDWLDRADHQSLVDAARSVIVQELQAPVNETLFSRTYFSLEEAGLGYLCLPKGPQTSDSEWSRQAAWLRVFADAYQLKDTRFEESAKPWVDENVPSLTNRVVKWATALVGEKDARKALAAFLEQLSLGGHPHGLIRTNSLRIRLTEPGDLCWRCPRCTRVHLHLGCGVCTRCFTPLSALPNEAVKNLLDGNFLALRVSRNRKGPFRLHCEELTGQTDDPEIRQRRFRGVIMSDPSEPTNEVVRKRDTIDLLAVTTTMEVGVDIGPLQAVFQANMPPQRFNYQQRVGRAGRRAQAFSMVVTVCRTRSHDLYYFHETSKITGDVPPPPFLTKGMPDIGRRFLRKWWLNAAFAEIRTANVGPWPADGMRPPDIHGEFLPTASYDESWRTKLSAALTAVEPSARQVAELLCRESETAVDDIWLPPPEVLREIDEVKDRPDARQVGLAHSLAELGKLPMYGMPTRTRDLYIGFKRATAGQEEEWVRIDRDLDLAVFEFAPGAMLRKDKASYRSIGFSGAMRGFSFRKKGNTVDPMGPAFGPHFWLLTCPNCNSWYRWATAPDESLPACDACGAQLSKEFSARCAEPLGFRSNFRHRIAADPEAPLSRHRSMVTDAGVPKTKAVDGTNTSASVHSGRLYRLNRGDADPQTGGTWRGFSAVKGEDRHKRGDREATFREQWLDPVLAADRVFGVRDFTPDPGADTGISGIWLAAPKTTDLLSISPSMVNPGLALNGIVGARALEGLSGLERLRALAATAVRASALSATFIAANRAALELDIDPEEFDVLDPRVARLGGGGLVPVLQIADHLVNGAGFVRALVANEHQLLRTIITSSVVDQGKYPLDKTLEGDHEQTCEQACYRCLLRFRNQPYHGLLDWRLGLSYLAALRSSDFSCGLDGGFDEYRFLKTWPEIVDRDIARVKREFPSVEDRTVGELRALRFDKRKPWAIIAHPLWNVDSPSGRLLGAVDALSTEAFQIVDSFNLARRPVTIRSALLSL